MKDPRRRITLALAILTILAFATVAYPALSPSTLHVLQGASHAPIEPLQGARGASSAAVPADCSVSSGNVTAGNWTTYHGSNARTGVEPDGNISSVHMQWTAPTSVDGDVYGEPLVCGSTIIVATENDSVYSLNATSGSVNWYKHLATPVPLSQLPCGNIAINGITSTPVLDAATGIVYVADIEEPIQHFLYGLYLSNGTVAVRENVNPPGVTPNTEQQRGALAIANGMVYIPYGGLWGDCGTYHGYVIGAPLDGAPPISYQVPTGNEGAIWGTAGMGFAANGSLYVATGNGASSTTFDFGDSVIELSPGLAQQSYFAPGDWSNLNQMDTDLGSVAPTVLPDSQVFQIGKAGVGYLLSGGSLGGISGQLAEKPLCNGAYGSTARVGATLLVPCTNGLFDVQAGSNLTVNWSSPNFDADSPMVTGNIAWTVDQSSSQLKGFYLSNGTPFFSYGLGTTDHFITPAASPSNLIVAGGTSVFSFALSGTGTSAPVVTSFSAAPSSITVGATVAFTTTAHGGNGPLTYAYSGLPSGCPSQNLPAFSCTPTGTGTFSVSVRASDPSGAAATAWTTLVVNPTGPLPLSISSFNATPNPVTVSSSTTVQVTASGGSGPLTYAYTGLPGGCASTNLSSFSCTPTVVGTFTVTVDLHDSASSPHTATSSFALTVSPTATSFVITSFTATPNPMTYGGTTTFDATTNGAVGTLAYAYTGLPPGCTSTSTPSFSCAPAAAGVYPIELAASTSTSQHAWAWLNLTVAAPHPPLLISTLAANPSTITLGGGTNITATTTGGAAPLSYTWTGLPGGCTSSDNPTLPCTPTVTGTFRVTLEVSDPSGQRAYGNTSIQVNPRSGASSPWYESSSVLLPVGLAVVGVIVVLAVAGRWVRSRRRRRDGEIRPQDASTSQAGPPVPPQEGHP